MYASYMEKFWRLVAGVEAHCADDPRAFEQRLRDTLRHVERCEAPSRGELISAFSDILAGKRMAPIELVPFLQWRLKWPEVHNLAERMFVALPLEHRSGARHLQLVLDSYSDTPEDEDLFRAWLGGETLAEHDKSRIA